MPWFMERTKLKLVQRAQKIEKAFFENWVIVAKFKKKFKTRKKGPSDERKKLKNETPGPLLGT